MSTFEHVVDQIREAASDYKPAPQVADQLRETSLVVMPGPFCVGKTTIAAWMAELDGRFSPAVSFTTRKRRPDENIRAYDWLPHNEKTLIGLWENEIKPGRLVQLTVHPANARIYGVRIEEFRHPYTILNTRPNSILSLQKLPFRSVHVLALAARTVEYEKRLATRQSFISLPEFGERINEGVDTLTQCLGRVDVIWIDNSDQKPEEVALGAIHAVIQEIDPACTFTAQTVGRELLVFLQRLQGEQFAPQNL